MILGAAAAEKKNDTVKAAYRFGDPERKIEETRAVTLRAWTLCLQFYPPLLFPEPVTSLFVTEVTGSTVVQYTCVVGMRAVL